LNFILSKVNGAPVSMEFLIYSAKAAEILYSNSTSLKASSLVLIPSLILIGDYL